MNNTCVYFHINPVKNEIFYVGIGNNKRPYAKKSRSMSEINKGKKHSKEALKKISDASKLMWYKRKGGNNAVS